MLDEVLDKLSVKSSSHIVDGTFGAGGYSKAFLELGARVTGFDRDPNAVKEAQALVAGYAGRLAIIDAPFSSMADHFEPSSVDGVVLDIGVSSMQLDQAERGFSFQQDGPLDMRMAQSGLTAADVVNDFAVNDLIRIIGILGEEKQASRIAKALVDQRSTAKFETTLQLANAIEKACPRKATDKIHPATRSFQGLRIFVNDELNELARALHAAESILKPGGRLVVVTFHSLEDRIVKRFFQNRAGSQGGSRHLPAAEPLAPLFAIEGKPVLAASPDEIALNPRSRSAKLRHGIRTQSAPRKADMSIYKLPNLPWPSQAGDKDGHKSKRRR